MGVTPVWIWMILVGAGVGIFVGWRTKERRTYEALAAADIETDTENITRALTDGDLTVEELEAIGLDPKPFVKRRRAQEGFRRMLKPAKKGVSLTVEAGVTVLIEGDLRGIDIQIRRRIEDARAAGVPAPDPGVQVVHGSTEV